MRGYVQALLNGIQDSTTTGVDCPKIDIVSRQAVRLEQAEYKIGKVYVEDSGDIR